MWRAHTPDRRLMDRRPIVEHAVDADVSMTFAWNYWSDVTNWDDPPAQFSLDGPFVEGAAGTTRIPGQAPIYWRVREVVPGRAATIVIPLEGAALHCQWRFEHLANRMCRITQAIVLTGERASDFGDDVRTRFESTLPAGMGRLARMMEEAHSNRLMRPMDLAPVDAGGVTVAEGPTNRRLLLDVDDTGRLIERCFSLGAQGALLYASNLGAAFFDLSSGEAGAILQRLRNFRIRLAVVCPPGSVRFSSRFGEMLAEEHLGRQFGIFETRDAALEWFDS
jgi:hypothetical protein